MNTRINVDRAGTSDGQLFAAATTICTRAQVGMPTAGHTGSTVCRVADSLKSTIVLLRSGRERICILSSHLGTSIDDTSGTIQGELGRCLNMARRDILVFSSHNHSVPLLQTRAITGYSARRRECDLTPLGKTFMHDVLRAARKLERRLEPVTVWHGCGYEGRISYNRKGRRADGSTYMMREEDRQLVGVDYRGDIDEHAPVVSLRRGDGTPVVYFAQFCAHPVTTYCPEKLIVSGDVTQYASDVLEHWSGAPVAFLQGCAGEINTKHLFSGDIARAKQYGRWLGQAFVRAARTLKSSRRTGFDFDVVTALVPLGPLPGVRVLTQELQDIDDFIRRGRAGDPNTLTCVGLNFPHALSAEYRTQLVRYVRPWSSWALRTRETDKAKALPKSLGIDVHVLRLGDVGIVGMPTEPFLGIGRQIRTKSPLPLTVPCGYVNQATGFVGYVPDGPNVGDRDYMSAFYRYTRYLPPFRRPAGDVMANAAIRILKRFAEASQ